VPLQLMKQMSVQCTILPHENHCQAKFRPRVSMRYGTICSACISAFQSVVYVDATSRLEMRACLSSLEGLLAAQHDVARRIWTNEAGNQSNNRTDQATMPTKYLEPNLEHFSCHCLDILFSQ